MRYFYAIILFVFSVLAFYFSTRIFYNKNKEKRIAIDFSVVSFGSGLWSLGYGAMLIVDGDFTYSLYRALGISGLIIFLVSGQYLLIRVGGESKLLKFIHFEEVVAILVYVSIIIPRFYRLVRTDKGIVTEFTNSFVSIFYTVFIAFVASAFIGITVYLYRHSKRKSIVAFSKSLLYVEMLIVVGIFIDTVLPAFGINFNIPASTMLQFLGLEIMYYAVHMINKNTINKGNLTAYIYDSLKSALFILDMDNKIKLANNEAKTMFDITDFDIEKGIDFWNEVIKSEAPTNVHTSDDTITIDAFFAPKQIYCTLYIDSILDDYGDQLGYVVMATDVTEQVNYTKDLEIAKEEAEKANSAKSRFLANMSHEIRTPMNSILGFSEIALKEEQNSTSREYFQDIHDSAEVLLATINDILDISKIESGKMELVCEEYYLARVIKDVSLIIGMQADKKGLEFSMSVDPNMPSVVYGDKIKVRAILINILNNGIKYTKEGFVKLNISYSQISEDMGRFIFEISDSGMGIKEEEIGHIFEVFTRADLSANKTTEGTGLGLSITKGFVEMMGGTISVESEYKKGTTFKVELEQKIIDKSPVNFNIDNAQSEEGKHLYFKNLEILAVDDSKVNLKVISKIMKQYGIDIDVAPSGEASIKMASQKMYDIIFMDQMMPVMDGVEAMRLIRERGGIYAKDGDCKIIALTANAIDGAKEELISQGFDGYLGKPIVVSTLEQMLTSIIPEDKYYYE